MTNGDTAFTMGSTKNIKNWPRVPKKIGSGGKKFWYLVPDYVRNCGCICLLPFGYSKYRLSIQLTFIQFLMEVYFLAETRVSFLDLCSTGGTSSGMHENFHFKKYRIQILMQNFMDFQNRSILPQIVFCCFVLLRGHSCIQFV